MLARRLPLCTQEIARKALVKKTGARGLRAILEDILLETMYEIPSKTDVNEVVVSENVVVNNELPLVVYEAAAKTAS